MIDIRPVPDLKNKSPEMESSVMEGHPIDLTQNGYGTMVVMRIESYSDLLHHVIVLAN